MFTKLRHRRIYKFLTTSNPQKLERLSEKLLLKAFHKAAKESVALSAILSNSHIDIRNINDVASFKKNVPVLTKRDFFVPFNPTEWIRKGVQNKIKTIMTSSGFSGTFAFGAELRGDTKNIRSGVDFTLDMLFKTSSKRTLLINCVPMGVHVETSLTIAETSVRSDMAVAIARDMSPRFEQTIIVGDPHFLKKLIEEGIEKNIDWKALNTSLICGQDYFPETYRTYMANLIGLDVNNNSDRLIMATMGTTELGLNVFHESFETIKLRRAIQHNPNLKTILPPFETKAVPYIFHYYPFRHYIEEIPEAGQQKALVFSILNKKTPVPLFRYHTGDSGALIPHNNLRSALTEAGLENLIPKLKLPLAAVEGRLNNFYRFNDVKIYPSDIKLGLYENHKAAGQTTGYFKINTSEKTPVIEIQLKPQIKCSQPIINTFSEALNKYLPAELPVKVYEYSEFLYGMKLDYESKFINID
jgi:phenylacetate-CoA ligase